MKTVNFLGQNWKVPDWANYITQDCDGSIWVWDHEPTFNDGDWLPVRMYSEREQVGKIPVPSSIKKI